MTIESSQKNTRGLRLVGDQPNGNVWKNFGPVRAGLTTTHRTQSQALSASLKELERQIDDLHDRYCQAYVTLVSVMEHLVRLGAIINSKDTTDTLQ